jgi:hypothetical protein
MTSSVITEPFLQLGWLRSPQVWWACQWAEMRLVEAGRWASLTQGTERLEGRIIVTNSVLEKTSVRSYLDQEYLINAQRWKYGGVSTESPGSTQSREFNPGPSFHSL